jgi:hypothetical protein
MKMRFVRRLIGLLGMICFLAGHAAAQRDRGELQIEVHDPQGAALATMGELVSEGNQFHLNFQVGVTGWSFCTKASERVYITASGCEIGFGGTRGL